MSKSYKTLDETQGRNRPCLRCFNCKTRVFRSLDKLEKFCDRQECHLNIRWRRRLVEDKEVQLYWCTKLTLKPRIFHWNGSPFIEHCKYFDGGDINGIT
jgi:hypothetical protein